MSGGRLSAETPDKMEGEHLRRDAANVTDHINLLRMVRRLELVGNLAAYCHRQSRIVVGGNCTTNFFSYALHVALLGRGVWAEQTEAGYDQWIPEALNQGSAIRSSGADLAVIWLSGLGLSRGGCVRQEPNYGVMEAAVDALRGTGSRVLMILPEPLPEEDNRFSPWVAWRRGVIEQLRVHFSSTCILVDPEPLIRRIGTANWHAPRYWTTSKLACHPNSSVLLAQDIAGIICQAFSPAVKLVVTDLDNTLWGGTVGEEGAAGIELDPHGTGAPFLRLQRLLKDAASVGIAVAIASKNNEADVLEVFDTRSEMVLQRDDLVGYRINWEDKYKNIADLAETLNLGLRNVCFLDDNPVERDEARHALPEVIVPELPSDPEEVVPFLIATRLLEIPLTSKEDLARNEYYKQDAKRRDLAARAFDVGDYLDSLEQRLIPRPLEDSNLSRVESLVNKTNQFNLTTRRHGAAQLAAWASDAAVYAHCFSVADRFGDAGIVGVLIALPEELSTMRIDTWLLSCRVMCRTVEHAMFAHLVDWCRCHHITTLIGEFVPTKKNMPVAELYDRLGFTKISEDATGGRRYRVDLRQPPPIIHHLAVRSTHDGL
jgi:FkbH-like protein